MITSRFFPYKVKVFDNKMILDKMKKVVKLMLIGRIKNYN